MTKRRNLRSRSKQLASRNLHHETLEKRELLASDLVSVSATVTEQFDLNSVSRLNESPGELTFRFGGDTVAPASLDLFTFTASGGDGTFNDGNETTIVPGALGYGSSDRIIVARFAGDLADDTYRINVPQDDSGINNVNVDFRLELGPRVVSVVPQPITGPSNNRVQEANKIDVYFNEDPLSRVSAGPISYSVGDATPPILPVVDPSNYRLFATGGTVETTDDRLAEIDVVSVEYDPNLNKVTLTLSQDLQSADAKDAYRLRIGSGADLADAPIESAVSEATTPGNSFASALASPTKIEFGAGVGIQSHVLVGGEIRNDGSYVLPWPGSYDTPGIRDQRRDSDFTRDSDSTLGINVYPYNFANVYGRNAAGQLLDNAITPAQKDRIREVLDLYEEQLGVRFVETADSGLQFVTGVLSAVLQTADTSAGEGTPKSAYRINESDPSKGVLVLDASENFFDGYGLSPDVRPSYFTEAIRGIGNVLGIGYLFELPTGIDGATGSQDEPNSEGYSNDGDGNGLNIAGFPVTTAEPDFLSQAAKVIGQAVNRPESDDVDMYAFSIDDGASGNVTIETYAQRLDEASLLDSVIRLYRVNGTGTSQSFELISRNDDSFGDDSQLTVQLSPGEYVVGVSSTGNESYYGEKDGNDTAVGGRSEGRYDLRITLDSQSQSDSSAPTGLTDMMGSPLDGDADGVAGGDFNFWFRAAADQTASPRTIFVDPDAESGNGRLSTPYSTIDDALAAANSGDIVRLLPSDGADDDLATQGDNVAYNIGRGGPNNAILRDGASFEIPAGVTVMIDAGSILKFSDSKIVAGSEGVDQDRSLAALQVLGTPENSVILTSLNDETAGQDEFAGIVTTPRAADWGGIEFRDDIDLVEGRDTFQSEGIFVNFVSHADIRYGGGRVRSTDLPTSAITIADARPTVIYNSITDSAGAAIKATPDAFREDTFNSPRYQRFSNDPENGIYYSFTSDYTRVGPEIVGNDLADNAFNGLSISIETPTGGVTDTMTVSGRFDDTDITHVITDSLTISGNPGGAILLEERPDVGSVTGTSSASGSLTATSYRYVVTFVTSEGQESLPSEPTRAFTTGGSIDLRNLPAAPDGFVGRRIYRADASATVQTYELIDQIDRSSSRFIDTGDFKRGGSLMTVVIPPVSGVTLTASSGAGTLVAGQGYDYRFTFTDQFGAESVASDSTNSLVALQDGTIQIAGIPQPPTRDSSDGIFTGTNVYRRNQVTGVYERIAELRLGETSIIDDGTLPVLATTSLGSTLGLDADRSSKLLPRYDARLSIAPGTVVKLDTSRIEVNFGADFYAEGTQDKPIVFTSIDDNTYGGSNFDTNSNPQSIGAAGDWGGISIRQSSTASFDYATIRYGGGAAVMEGALRDTNALEILQADVRVANSRFVDNADGFSETLSATENRLGRGFNAPATIFIRGSQPIIIDNVIDRGQGAAISINPDSFSPDANIDHGRSTGLVDLHTEQLGNQGPLIAGNAIANHGLNGLDVRGEIVTIDSVWDDTDITHIVQSPIHSLTNAYGGALRLRSDSDASLVVKFGPEGTLNADGRPLDIEDRIGGTLQILGSPAFPVVLTSLNDDTVGGGFTPSGTPGVDTVGPQTLNPQGNPVDNPPAPGDWIGLRIGSFANDRNVAFRYETELPIAADESTNDSPGNSQALGSLAARENASDENERLGFNVRGLLSSPSDVDVYSFSASGGTEVVLDIDDTSNGLDTLIELVTVSGQVIASSDNSRDESVGITPIFVNENLPEGVLNESVRPLATTITSSNVESPNAADSGFKIQLPGDTFGKRDYYIRVSTAEGITSGQYTLSVRLDDADETAGSNIRRADIRYAATAVDVVAAPLHSPLGGEVSEAVTVIDPTPEDGNSGDESTREVVDLRLNQNFGSAAQSVGNLLTSDRGSLVVTGELGNLSGSLSNPALYNSLLDERLEDVDIYRVDLFAQQIAPDMFDSENRFVTTTFDIDYADQLGRPDTRLSVFDSAGQLILVGHDSNIADDNARPVEGVDSSNLSGGSSGASDAYIGPVELPEGTYYVAVSSAAVVPQSLDQFFDASPADPLTRLVPINSIRRVTADNFDNLDLGTPVGFSGPLDEYTAEDAYIIPSFDGDSAVPYTLDDISLFVSYDSGIDGNDAKSIAAFNPFTGVMTRLIGDSAFPVGDIAMRRDGNLFSYSLGPNAGNQTSVNSGNFQRISATDGSVLTSSDDLIVFRSNTQNAGGTAADTNAQFLVRGSAFVPFNGSSPEPANSIPGGERLYVIGQRDNNGRGNEETALGITGIPSSLTTNIVYSASASTGEIGSGSSGNLNVNADRNFPAGPYDISTGPASDEIEVGVVDTGQIDLTSGKDGGNITGIAFRNLASGGTNGELVAVTDAGGIHVFSPNNLSEAPIGSSAEGYNRVITTTYLGNDLEINPRHVTATLQFTGLTYSPMSIEEGEYRDTYFATTADGWLYAFRFETVNDQLAVIPADVFYNGQASVELSFGSSFGPIAPVGVVPNGLAFSTLQVNPFHLNNDRRDDAGHNLIANYDASRLTTTGGNSLYFGFDQNSGVGDNTLSTGDGAGGRVLSPGGLQGSAISGSIDLSNYSAEDRPTLYFTYFIDVEDSANNLSAPERDTFRVFGSGEDGQYRLLATNDDFRSLPNADSYDEFNRVIERDLDTTPGFEAGIPVQEIFDTTPSGQWRQARVDLSPFAGDRDIKLRFDFASAGARLDQFGSVELVARDGEVIPDNDLVLLQNDDFQGAVLQTILGQDIIFNDGSNYNDGDALLITGADGTFTTLQFVADVNAVLPAGTVGVALDASATPDEVAMAVAAVLPNSLSPRVDGNGRLSLLRATNVTVDDSIDAGQANPVPVENLGLTILVTPSAIEAVDGEQVEVTVAPGQTLTFTYRRLGNESADPNVRRFEIVFDDSVVTADLGQLAVAQEASSIINAAFIADFGPQIGQVSYVNSSDVRFVSFDTTVVLTEGPSELNLRSIVQPRVRAEFGAGDITNDDETILLEDPDGNQFVVVLNDDGDIPVGVVPAGATPIDVTFDSTFTAEQVRDAVLAQTLLVAPSLVARPEDNRDGDPVAVTFLSTIAVGDQRDNQFTSNAVKAVLIRFPDGQNIINDETIRLVPAVGAPVEVTFDNAGGVSSANTVVYQFDPNDPANNTNVTDIIADFIGVALGGAYEIGTAGSNIVIYGIDESEVVLTTGTSFQKTAISGRRVSIPSGAQINDRDTIQATVNPLVDATETIANQDLFTFIDGGAVRGAAIDNGSSQDVTFFADDDDLTIRDIFANRYTFSIPSTSPGGQTQLLIPANGFVSEEPALSVDPLRFESFVEVDLPTNTPAGTGLRTGETIDLVLPGIGFETLVFVRQGAVFTVPNGQIPIFFNEASDETSLGLQIADRINQLSEDILIADGLPTGFGIVLPGASASLGTNPLASSVTVTEPESSYAIPITVPRGELISEGETLEIFRRDRVYDQAGQLFEFSNNPGSVPVGVTAIPFTNTDTAADLTQRLLALLPSDMRAEFAPGSSRTLLLANASSVIVSPGDNGESSLISFQASVNTTLEPGAFGRSIRATPVLINQASTSDEVALALQSSMTSAFGALSADPFAFVDPQAGVNTVTADRLHYKIEAGDRLRLFSTSVIDAGNYGLNTFLPGDEHGTSVPTAFAGSSRSAIAGQNNQFEGIYIDDIIVGFAERGEMVLNSGNTANFTLNPEYTPDSRSSNLNRPGENTDQPENPDQILVGQYSLEIRTGDNYGVPQDYDPYNLVLEEAFGAGRSFDTNDRLSDGAVTMIFPSGQHLIDGDRFVLSDGLKSLTFEYNSVFDNRPSDISVDSGNVAINFDPSDTDFDIARKTRDAINQEQFSSSSGGSDVSGLRIRALSGDGSEVGATSSHRLELFGDEILVNPTFHNRGVDQLGDLGRVIKIDAVEAETPFGDYTSNRVPVIDQDTRTVSYLNLGDQLASATVTDYVPGDTLVASGKIGDQVAKGIDNNVSADDGNILLSDPQRDIDTFRIFLTAGATIDIDVDTNGLFRDSSRLAAPVVTVVPSGTVFGLTPNFTQNVIGFAGFFSEEAGIGETASGAQLTFQASADGYYDVFVSSRFVYQGGALAPDPDTESIDAGFGEYQMTIRPSLDPSATDTETGISQVGVPNRDVLFVDYQFGKTDSNRVDDQGQILIEGNIIRDSLNFAIDASIGARGQTATSTGLDEVTVPGSTRLLRNPNTSALIPGTVIVNNLIIDNIADAGAPDDANATGIRFAGGSFANGEVASPNVFGRIINNTIIGDGDGTAIDIGGRSAPSIINNVVVDTATGVTVDTVTANQTVAASNVFAGVVTPSNIEQGTTTIILETSEGLFSPVLNDGERVFVPGANSVLVDSSLETLRDRIDFANSVKGTVNIAPSPVLAPQTDALGNPRVDSPGVGQGGTGGNVAVDRGAIEQVDLRSPTARLSSPLDAVGSIVVGGDAEPAPAVVRLASVQALPFIEVELTDLGVGLDLGSVNAGSVTLLENGLALELGTDYTFAFAPTGTTIRLTSTSGQFRNDSTYEVVLDPSIRDLAGNSIAPTNAQGETILTIITSGVVVDFGDAPASYGTLSADGGPAHSSPALGSVILGSRVDTETDAVRDLASGLPGSLGVAANADDLAAMINVDLSGSPSLAVAVDGDQTKITVSSVPSVGDVVSIDLGGSTFVAEFSSPTQNTAIGRTVIEVEASSTVQSIAAELSAVLGTFLAEQNSGVSIADSIEDDAIILESFDDEDGLMIGTTNQGGRDYFVFGKVEDNGTILDSNVDGLLISGESTTISVNVTGQGFLDAWIDFGGDGTFDAQDRIASGLAVSDGNNFVTVNVPAGRATTIDTYARFRVSSAGGLGPTGVTPGGEVEDYRVTIAAEGSDFGLPINTKPTFDIDAAATTIPESETSDVQTVTNFLTNLFPGSPDKPNENQLQSIASVVISNVGGTAGLLVPNSLSIVTPGTGGVGIDSNTTGDLNFAINPNLFGEITFDIVATDSEGLSSDPVSVTLTVQSINNAPIVGLVEPIITVAENSAAFSDVQIDPRSPGPIDEQDQTLSFIVEDLAPQFAELFSVQPAIDVDGVLTFTVAPGLNTALTGDVPISVIARDSGGTANGGVDSTVLSFSIKITEVNNPPVAVQDQFAIDEDNVLRLTVADLLGNDEDPDLVTNPNEELSMELAASSFSVNGARVNYDEATGMITYDPTDPLVSPVLQALENDGTTAQTLVDSFQYRVVDASGLGSNFVSVQVTVTGINDAPILELDTPTLNANGSTTITPLENDKDIDGEIDATSIEIPLQPAFGSVQVTDEGTIIYTPFDSFRKDDTFRYTVADNFGLRSEPQLITISLNPSPDAQDDSFSVLRDESGLLDVAANDSDPNGQLNLAGITIVRSPVSGTAVPQTDGTVLYTPNSGYVGADTFTYQVSDDEGRLSNVATTRIQVVSSSLQNPNLFDDVNADGFVTAIDALLIVNHLGREGQSSIPVLATDQGPNFYDVDGNRTINTLDALMVIQELERIGNSRVAEREQVFAAGFDSSTESRLAAASTGSAEFDSIDNDASDKLLDVSGPTSQIDDVIDTIAVEPSKSDSDSETSAIDEALTGLF